MWGCLEGAGLAQMENQEVHIGKCAPAHPGFHAAWIYALEMLRCCLLYRAAYLLETKQAFGGEKEILALEDVRLDIADGSLDGVADRKQVKKVVKSKASGKTKFDDAEAKVAQARSLDRRASPRSAPCLSCRLARP